MRIRDQPKTPGSIAVGTAMHCVPGGGRSGCAGRAVLYGRISRPGRLSAASGDKVQQSNRCNLPSRCFGADFVPPGACCDPLKESNQNQPLSSPLRCAIYTRKSTEEGLEQEFNSLAAQREAAEAYIKSQRREGWIALPELFDDGGFTGANMDRPALTRLLQAVEAGELDCVVVYKVDRLSRSLPCRA